MRAAIAMMADEDLETLVELRKIRFVRAEEEHQLRRGRDHIGDAALLRIAEHQPPHPRRAHMDDVEALPHPAVFERTHHLERLREPERPAMPALQPRAARAPTRTPAWRERGR